MLLVAYLIQLAVLLFLEKDVVITIPLWFQDRYKNVQWLSQCIGNFYQRLYLKLTTEMPTYAAMGILLLASAIITIVICWLIRMGLCYLLRKWKKAMESDFMGLSISMVMVTLLLYHLISMW